MAMMTGSRTAVIMLCALVRCRRDLQVAADAGDVEIAAIVQHAGQQIGGRHAHDRERTEDSREAAR